MAIVTSSGCQVSPVQFGGTELREPWLHCWSWLEEGLVGGLGCWGVAGSGREPGTRGPLLSGVTETTAAGRGLDSGIWYQTATSPLDKGRTSSDGGQDRGLGRPHPTSRLPPQPAGSGAPIEPPTSAPSAQGPGAGEAAAPKRLSLPQLLESGGAPKPWRSPSPEPSVLGPHLVLEAPTCVVVRGTFGEETGQEQLQVEDVLGAHMTCRALSPINVYPGAEAPEGHHRSPGTRLVQAPLSRGAVAGLGRGS